MNIKSSIIYTNEEGTWVVDLLLDGVVLESRTLPGHNQYYAEDVAENWETGIIKLAADK